MLRISTIWAISASSLSLGSSSRADFSCAAALEQWQARPTDLAAILDDTAAQLKSALELLPNDSELAEMAQIVEILSND